MVLDLEDKPSCYTVPQGAHTVYYHAADMGEMGFIENNKALCMLSVLINTYLLMEAKDIGIQCFFVSVR
jgi:GDP-D-mannose 3',5'-epimerase